MPSAQDERIHEMPPDDWHAVEDPKARKRIQDRLAQRIRRKKLRDAKKIRETREEVRIGLASNMNNFVYDAPFVVDMSGNSSTENLEIALRPSLQPRIPQGQRLSLAYEIPAPITVFGALFINGKILGLTCFSQVATRSPPASEDTPWSLRPTETQLLTLHTTGIDRFPFPKMRDNYINMAPLIDEEDFSLDIFTKPSFDIKPGRPAWDPDAWIPAKSFLEKWGFLLA